MIPVFNRLAHLSIGLLIASSCAFSNAARAAEVNPLRPVDTASPGETLQDFVVTVDGIYRGLTNILQEYAASQRLYLTPDERRRQVETLSAAAKAIKVLDLSDIPPVLQQTVAAERAIQLKEILDRIELPSFDSVPDGNAAASLPGKRWRLPETEIDIALIENGPRSGEYLVSAGTVDRLPEFYERVKKLPYKPGPAAELSDVYRKLSSGSTATIYDAYLSSPVGLERIVPIRWMLRLPAWAKSPIAGVALWQWLGLAAGLAVCLGFVYGIYRLNRHLVRRRAEEFAPPLAHLPDAAGDHSRDGLPGALALHDIPDRRDRAHRHHLYADGRVVSQRRLAFHDRREPSRRIHRGIGASATTQPG